VDLLLWMSAYGCIRQLTGMVGIKIIEILLVIQVGISD